MNFNVSVSTLATVEMEADLLDFLDIDEDRKCKEVEQIAGSEVFQQLQETVRRLREEAAETDVRDPLS